VTELDIVVTKKT